MTGFWRKVVLRIGRNTGERPAPASGAGPAPAARPAARASALSAPPLPAAHRNALLKAIGPCVAHCTAAENLPSIKRHGLHSAAALARLTGGDPQTYALRETRPLLRGNTVSARLNDQKPLLAGRNSAADSLDGHTLASWAQQLDERIFFWPGTGREAFKRRIDEAGALATLMLDTEKLLDLYGPSLDLSPINSGSFTRKPAYRGDWLYVPATSGMERFRTNRTSRGLVMGRDTIVELSLTCSIPADELDDLSYEGT